MSLAEVMPYEDEAPRSNDRTPPQDLPAEQCVLGAMLMSKDAIADVVETLRGTDFYRPAHEQVFDAVLDLYGRGEPADAITVASELTKKGEIGRVGGAPYLHTLLASVPVAANAGYYAEIVREKAILRRLVNASLKIGQMSYAAEGDVTDIVDQAQAEVYSVTDRRASEDYKPLSELMQPTLDEIEAIGSRGGQLAGVPTGFLELDDLTNGLHAGQMVIVAARPGMGKALALDTDLPTPTGWTTMGEIQVGQRLVGADGRPTTVTAATEIMLGRRCFQIQFTDGTSVIADANHQWSTTRRDWAANAPVMASTAGDSDDVRGPRWRYTEQSCVVTSAEMARAAAASADVEWSIPGSAALNLPMAALPVRAYELGRWLVGAPGTEITRDVLVEAEMPLDRIPVPFLRGSECQRRDLLAGLLDWGRSRAEDGEVELTVHGERLAVDVHELLLGLGFGPLLRQCGEVEGVSGGSYALRFDPHRTSKERRVHAIREVPSVPVRCVEVDADDHLYLASRAMIPTHNSTLGLDLCRSASIKNGLTSAIFSLEMSQIEITMRLLSAEANIPLNHIRNGKMSDDDWQRMARKMGEVSEAPLFIDDSPNLTMMEIRAKARRLRQRHDLKLVVIDYIQLMTSGKKVESRQLEVSEFSRNLKLLAKELEVPVVALSQLNRGPEQRNDKKPMLSDLRESGCLTAETRILRADNGHEVALGDLLASGARNIPVWSLDERHRLVQRTMTHVFPSGTKEVYRLKLASGREITATANHPFLTYDGWRELGALSEGSRIAAPRQLPEPAQPRVWDKDELTLLAHMLGDGSFVKRQPIRYASIDEANLTAVSDAAHCRFKINSVRDDYPAARVTTLRLPAPYRLTHGRRNPIAAWLDEFGLFGLRSHEKFVPPAVLGASVAQIRHFIRHIWATDGSVRWDAKANQGRIYYASTSRRLIDDVARLLLRCGIVARIKTVTKSGYRDGYHLYIYGAENQLRFCDEIGVHGLRGEYAREVAGHLRAVRANTNLDTVPVEVWGRVREALAEQHMAHRSFAAAMEIQFCGSTLWKHALSRGRLAKAAQILHDPGLEASATNDVFWDSVVAIEPLGEREVYDATVLGTHNFVADGIVVHNSLEQDADMVILLNRPDIHDKESERAGEADIDVAKHRNGPTRTITVAFQGHYSRFMDMQH